MSKDNPIDRTVDVVLWLLDKPPVIVAGIGLSASYAVDQAPVGVRGVIVVAAILATYFVAYGAGICDKFIEEWKAERKERRL